MCLHRQSRAHVKKSSTSSKLRFVIKLSALTAIRIKKGKRKEMNH